MPVIPEHYRQQKLATLTGVGQLSAADISAATQEHRELARAGRMLSDFGINFLRQKEKTEFHNQLNTAKTQYLTKFFEYEQGLRDNADTETYLPNLETSQAEAANAYKFTNKRAENEFNLWKANEDLSQTKRVSNFKHGRDIQNYIDNWNLNIKEATRRTSTAIAESDYQLELANARDLFGLELVTEERDGEQVPKLDKDGNPVIQLKENWENPLLDSDEVRLAGYRGWKADADAKRERFILEEVKTSVETEAFRIAADQGYGAAEEMLRDPDTTTQLLEAGMKREDVRSLLNDIRERVKHEKVQIEEKIEAQREIDRGQIYDAIEAGEVKLPDGTTSTDIRAFIESSSLDEKEQEAMWQKSIKETDRKAKGQDIITNPRLRSRLYKDTMGILTGAQTRDDILDRANNARFGDYSDPNNPIEPTLSDKDYKPLVNSINAQYEQGYGQMMSKVNAYAEGILLKTDSLGFVENAPVRYKTLGDFQEAWLQWVAGKGDQLKISEIYPEGRRLAATFQISDDEAARQEEIINIELKIREAENKVRENLGLDATEGEVDAELKRRKVPRPDFNAPREERIKQFEAYSAAAATAGKIKKTKTKKLTPKIARRYLDITGNDVEEAKRLAAEDGYIE